MIELNVNIITLILSIIAIFIFGIMVNAMTSNFMSIFIEFVGEKIDKWLDIRNKIKLILSKMKLNSKSRKLNITNNANDIISECLLLIENTINIKSVNGISEQNVKRIERLIDRIKLEKEE